MKTNKLATLVAVVLLTTLSISSVSAKGNGSGTNAGSNSNYVDVNGNGIADGKEDFDNDGILNKDDADYVKTQNQDATNRPEIAGEGKGEKAGTGEGNNEKGQGAENRSEKAQALKAKIGRNADAVDGLMTKFSDKYSDLNIEDQKEKFETLLGKVNTTLEKIQNSKLDESKKEAYMNTFEYIKVQTELKIEGLDEDIDLDSIFN